MVELVTEQTYNAIQILLEIKSTKIIIFVIYKISNLKSG